MDRGKFYPSRRFSLQEYTKGLHTISLYTHHSPPHIFLENLHSKKRQGKQGGKEKQKESGDV